MVKKLPNSNRAGAYPKPSRANHLAVRRPVRVRAVYSMAALNRLANAAAAQHSLMTRRQAPIPRVNRSNQFRMPVTHSPTKKMTFRNKAALFGRRLHANVVGKTRNVFKRSGIPQSMLRRVGLGIPQAVLNAEAKRARMLKNAVSVNTRAARANAAAARATANATMANAAAANANRRAAAEAARTLQSMKNGGINISGGRS